MVNRFASHCLKAIFLKLFSAYCSSVFDVGFSLLLLILLRCCGTKKLGIYKKLCGLRYDVLMLGT